MSKKKFYAGMSKAMIATLIATSLATTVFAADGDFHKDGTNMGGIKEIILNRNKLLDLVTKTTQYTYEIDGKLYNADQVDKVFTQSSGLKIEEIHNKIKNGEIQPVGTIPAEDEELKVESVSAINGVTVEVEFNKAVDKDDAEATVKVSIEGVTLTNPKLSEDGKTLTLTAAMTSGGGAIDVEDATVIVEPIESKEDAKVKSEKYVGLMTYEDKVAPEIVNVKATTNGTTAEIATIELSEPVKSGALVKVNGSYVTVAPFAGANSDKLELTGLKLETGKTHTVEVINAEDVAGNKVVSMSASFTVSVDNVAPVATVSAGENDKEILVTFNKEMNPAKVTGITVKDETLSPVNVGSAVPVTNSDNKQFTITISDTIYTNKDSRTFSVVLPKDMEDTLGNKTVDSVQSVTLNKDTVKPVATGYNVVKDSDGKVEALEISFSEGLKANSITTGTTLNVATSSIVNSNGVLDTTTFADFKSEAVAAGDKKVVFKDATPAKIEGEFAISFNNELVTDQSEAGNKSAAFSYTIDFGEGKKDTEFELAAQTAANTTPMVGSGNTITVTYPEAVKGGAVAGSATDLANYTLGGKPLPTGTTITLDSDQKVATIKLPSESVEKDDQAAILTVANVKNLDGTKTVKSYAGTVKIEDNIKPILESAKIIDNKTIELTYSEDIATLTEDTDVASAFEIKNGSTTAMAFDAGELVANNVSGFDNKVRIAINKPGTAGTPAQPATAVAGGANSSIVAITNGENATTDATLSYTIATNSSTSNLEVLDESSNAVATLDASGNGSFTVDNVTVTIKGAVENDKFTITTTAPVAEVPGTSATVLDLTKDITVETKDSSVVVDKAGTPNGQKAEVKVTVAK